MAKKQQKSKSKSNKKQKVEKKEEEEIPSFAKGILLADDDDSSDDSASQESESEEEEVTQPQVKANTKEEQSEEEEGSVASENQTSDEESLPDTPAPSLNSSSPAPAPVEVELAFQSDGKYHNKQRCLILASRGVTSRYRHLLEDLRTLIPHHKKESKLDAGKNDKGGIGAAVNDICEIRGCNSVLFLEMRKRQDCYLWLGHTGGTGENSGPSAKFLIENIHTMDELKLTGNCMRGSRPILTFDSSFEDGGRKELQLLKCLFVDIFGTPRGHPKSKPFVDRVMGFYYADGKIWVRNYQIVEEHASNAKEAHVEKKTTGSEMMTSLVEIGPRFVLNPIRIFRGSFGGQTLYQNENFVSPNQIRSEMNAEKGNEYEERRMNKKKRKERSEGIVVPKDPLAGVFQ